MAKKTNKYYVVWSGHKPGVYENWAECQQQVNGYDKAKFKSFSSQAEAERALKDGWNKHWGQKKAADKTTVPASERDEAQRSDIDYDSISVDVGTRGNPGPIEYKGVDTKTGEVLFQVGPIKNGTNNLGEFIAIVHALAYLNKQGSKKTVYTDSKTALSWLKKKKVGSSLERTKDTEKVWELADRAVNWLETHQYDNKVLKWNTEKWGEIKADYGRK